MLTDQYSSVVLNQNAIVGGQINWRGQGANWIYQTFTLPSDYPRGTDASEVRIPDLSGFQVFVSIDQGFAASASLDYVLQYYNGDNDGWVPLASGTVMGAHTDGSNVWFDVVLPQSIPIQSQFLTKQFRFGIQGRTATGAAFNSPVTVSQTEANTYIINGQSYTASLVPNVPFPITVGGLPAFLLSGGASVHYYIQQGISELWYVTPTPLQHAATGQGQAYQSDGITPLLGPFTTACLNFRILALTADNGTDFLDNEYRSVVVQTASANVSTTRGLNPVSGSGQSGYWMSPPSPSRFAVQSLYFDVRPMATNPILGTINNIGNPSFEYDAPGQAPQWWSSFASGGTLVNQSVRSTTLPPLNPNFAPWSYDRFQSLHMAYTFSATNQQRGIISGFQTVAPTTGLAPISVSLAYDIITATNCSLFFTLLFYDNTQTLLPSPFGTMSFDPAGPGTGTFSASTMIPAGTQYVKYLVSALSTGSGSFEAYVDAVQVTFTSSAQPYFDGDDVNCTWTAARGNSPSAQLIQPTPGSNAIVTDGVLVDPLTPNMAFNVYYSQDDTGTSNSMTEIDWEQKLWTRVPQTYICTQRQQYVFPAPVAAKYMKVEFTNLQSQSYDPGNFQKPIQYKKFPTWVANYFIEQMELPSFIGSQVNVQFDALTFAYDYFLDDLGQEPLTPVAPPQTALSQLTNFFSPTNANAGLDSTTLGQISLVMNPFQNPITSNVDSTSSLGSFVSALGNGTNNPVSVVEGGTLVPVDYSTVSSLQREPVVLEQSLPVMYFFITCRHTYKELTASFEYNRAYFAGVNDIAFLRNNYTVAADTPLYIESGSDLANTAFTDWVQDSDTIWYTY